MVHRPTFPLSQFDDVTQQIPTVVTPLVRAQSAWRIFNMSMAQHSMLLYLVSLGFLFSVHNLIAPNMTEIAKLFHFNNYQRDAYIGGELTLVFYLPGIFVALIFGVLSAIAPRKILFSIIVWITALSCLATTFVSSFQQLAWARAVTGIGLGGALPLIYSLVGDWFPAKSRSTGTAYVSATCGVGVFTGQIVAAIFGHYDWRWPFLLISIPLLTLGFLIMIFAEDPSRGAQEECIDTLYGSVTGYEYSPTLSYRNVKQTLANRTNTLVILQAFPGNIPWGVIIVYLHDFLIQDIGMNVNTTLMAIAVVSIAGFCGVFVGGYIGELIYDIDKPSFTAFLSMVLTIRAIPFFFIFGWREFFGPLVTVSHYCAFFFVLFLAGFASTMASPGLGAMLLNVNLPEARGTIFAFYSVLDDVSKGFGTLFISWLVPVFGGRAMAYQIALILWIFCGFAMIPTWWTFGDDEVSMKKALDEAAYESMVRSSKQKAHIAVSSKSKIAAEACCKPRILH